MNKSEPCTRVAERASVSRETARSVVNVVVSVIGEALASDETVAIAGFGCGSHKSYLPQKS